MAQKTNAIRILESLGIPYETALYEADAEHLEAMAVARSEKDDIETAILHERIYVTAGRRAMHCNAPFDWHHGAAVALLAATPLDSFGEGWG